MSYKLQVSSYKQGITLLFVAVLFALPLQAQVTIGDLTQPHPFSLLEIISKTSNVMGGLRLPQLTYAECAEIKTALTTPTVSPEDVAAANGLVVFNIESNCLEFWNGNDWISVCGGAFSPFIVPDDTQKGSGTLKGRTLFDIAESNFDGDCGLEATRKAVPSYADFAQASVNTQVYTFTAAASGSVSNVRYVITDPKNLLLPQPLSGTLIAGTMANSATTTLTLHFRTDLNSPCSPVYGLTRENTAKVIINIIYFDGTEDVKVQRTLKVQDCLFCGVYVAEGDWQEFMCYNMGAIENGDPFTQSPDLNGDYYQWGCKTPAIAALADPGATTLPGLPTTWYGSTGSVLDVNSTDKSATDPCPDGYRVPNQNEWAGVLNNTLNPKVDIGTWIPDPGSATAFGGSMFGKALFLPAAGYRPVDSNTAISGALSQRGAIGYYWSSTVSNLTPGNQSAYCTYFYNKPSSGTTNMMGSYFRHAQTIRCIAE